MNEQAILIDLERTLGTGLVHFWKRTEFGYTTKPGEAGRFHKDRAASIVQQDRDNNTVMVPAEQFQDILIKYGEIID